MVKNKMFFYLLQIFYKKKIIYFLKWVYFTLYMVSLTILEFTVATVHYISLNRSSNPI
jgi:hypothetical protein